MQTCKLRSRLTALFSSRNISRRYAVTATAVENKYPEMKVNEKPWHEIPGPPSLPLIGQMHHFLPGGIFHGLSSHEFARKAIEIYGPIVRLDGGLGKGPTILLLDAESIAQVLRGENSLPFRPAFYSLQYYRTIYKNKNKKKNEPSGLLTDQGDIWKRLRSTVNPVVMQPKTIKLYHSSLDEVAKDMIKRLRSIRGDNNMIKSKFDVEMNLWALESIGVIALGGRLNCFDLDMPNDAPTRQLIKVVHDFFEVTHKLDFGFSFWKYFATPAFKKAMFVYAEQERLLKYFIDKAKTEFNSKKKVDDEKGVLEKLLGIDEKVAHIMASDMLIEGVDTVSNTMTFILYFLASNQDKQEKLREELMSADDKRPYLKACIKETFRLIPVVSGNLRISTKEYNLLGYKIPKGVKITFCHQDMALSEKNYKNANEFIPERWIVSEEDPMYHGNAHPFAYIPFGFGTRMCLGRRIAELEIQSFLARLIQNFQVEWLGPPLKVTHKTLNYAAGPFNFVFKDV